MKVIQRSYFVACGAVLAAGLGCASVPPAAPAPAAPTSAQAGATTVVAVAAPAPPQMTLPEFIGLKGLCQATGGLGQRIRNRLGSRFPGLEAKPPLLAMTDPANMSEDASPAVQAAAEAKAEEDTAAQKAKAIRYLASLGCGKCYPDTEAALLAALDDCNEQIRWETVKGLRKSVGDPCKCCRQNLCCSPELIEKLSKLAYDADDSGCYVEPSPRVRRYARLVISGCGGPEAKKTQSSPYEGPSSAEQVPDQPVAASGGNLAEGPKLAGPVWEESIHSEEPSQGLRPTMTRLKPDPEG